MKRVILISDHAIVRIRVRDLLEASGGIQVVAEASSRSDALILLDHAGTAREQRPTLAILDLVLDQEQGLDFVSELKDLHPELNILVVAMFDPETYAPRVLAAGAHGFTRRRDAHMQLLPGLDALSAGETYLFPAIHRDLSTHA